MLRTAVLVFTALAALRGVIARDESHALFQSPPASARILRIIHGWPDSAEAQDALIRRLKDQGFGGAVCNVSFTEYLRSEPRWSAFRRAVEQAKAAGLALWLYDEKGYPSGSAGGLTLQGRPELEARGMLVADEDSAGGDVSLKLPPGRLLLGAAFPQENGRIRLEAARTLATDSGYLRGQLPAGRWKLIAVTEDRLYAGTHAEMSLADRLPYINLLDRAATARFLEVTHEEYARRLGPDLGRWFEALFTDEPSLMSLFLRPMPYRVLPWSASLPEEFRRRSGQALEPLIPALVTDAGPAGMRARYAFWQTIAELVSENYFGQIQAWGRRHGVPSGGHLLMEESLTAHVPLYGDLFRCARRLDAPSIDCLTSIPAEAPWFIARLISSAADLEGRALTMCETSDHGQVYRPAGDTRPVRTVTEEEIRGTLNRLMVNGINSITSYYSFRGLSDEALRRLSLWTGRVSGMLRGGSQVSDVALLYPIESVWPRFTPARHGATDSPEASRIESVFSAAGDTLYASGRDFTCIDSRTLRESKVENGILRFRGFRWRAVILPHADTLPLAAWRNLARFWRSGGIVVALGARPANTDREFPSAPVAALADEMFGGGGPPSVRANRAGGAGVWLPPGTESLLSPALDMTLERDVAVSERGSPIRATHRRIGSSHVYFVINDSGSPWSGTIRLSATGPGERLDPAEGTIAPAASGSGIALDLPGYGGALFRFRDASPPSRKRIESGPLPGLVLKPLPRAEPRMGAGEHVRGELTADGDGWNAVGALTRGGVDTFLFFSHVCPSPLDLSGTEGLAIEWSVPAEQKSAARLIVIARDRDGGEYMAVTGSTLSTGPDRTVMIPWSRFQLFGWSRDRDGRLDLAGIAAISVGWGGYYGSEGERIAFRLGPLRAFSLPLRPAQETP